MKKIFLCVMILLIFSVCASADIVYNTTDGKLGLIKVNGASLDLRGIQYASSNSDLLLGSYWDGSESRVIIVDRKNDLTTSGDTALIFDPNDLTKTIGNETKILTGVYNPSALTGTNNGRGLFFISGATISGFNSGTFNLDHSYTYKIKSSDITPNITAILTGTYSVYVTADMGNYGGKMLEFDGQLRDDIEDYHEYNLNYGASSIAWLSGSRLVVGHENGIDVLTDTENFVRLISTDVPVKAVRNDKDGGLYFITQAKSGDIYTTTLNHRNNKNELTTLYTENSGEHYALNTDSDSNILAVVLGSKILVYTTEKDTLVGEFDSDSLGGLPVNAVMSYVSGDKNSSSNGCNISGLGIMMIFSGFIFMKKH